MSSPFFNSAERIKALQVAAEKWVGTPFVPNAAIPGHGVSCQKLAGSIYIDCGLLPAGFAIPEAPMDWGRAHKPKDSLITAFIATRKEFEAVGKLDVKAGDLVGFMEGGCVHHLGVVISRNIFMLCNRRDGVKKRRVDDAVYIRLRANVWRPVIA